MGRLLAQFYEHTDSPKSPKRYPPQPMGVVLYGDPRLPHRPLLHAHTTRAARPRRATVAEQAARRPLRAALPLPRRGVPVSAAEHQRHAHPQRVQRAPVPDYEWCVPWQLAWWLWSRDAGQWAGHVSATQFV